ncbi:MAG: hypothetical protein Q9196_004461 [Gyalolechia fulgens]
MPGSRHSKRPRNGPGASARTFVCGLCNKGFSRRHTVKEPHFLSCVRRKGNPGNLPWDSHPSCWVVHTDGTRGPSGTSPPSNAFGRPNHTEAKIQESDSALTAPCKQMSPEDPSGNANTTSTEQPQDGHGISSSPDLLAPWELKPPWTPRRPGPARTEEGQEREVGSSSSPFLPAYPDPETPLAPYRLPPHPGSQLASTPPSQFLSPYQLLSHPATEVRSSPPSQSPSFYRVQADPDTSRLPSLPSLGLPEPVTSISSLALNQMASIAIGATREKAGINDEEAWRMWTLWTGLLPRGVESDVAAPIPGASQKDRQQAVVWLGQDVYAGLLAKSEGRVADRLRMTELWQDVVRHLNDEDAANRMHDLLLRELEGARLTTTA